MKLSEAIRLGAMLKPQGFGPDSVRSHIESCALGAALDAIGVPMNARDGDDAYDAVRSAWPDLPFDIDSIWGKNDAGWTRERIADWVAAREAVRVVEEWRVIEKVKG